VLVADFGIAGVVADAAGLNTGEIIGTPEFMSPEQALGETVDSRSDLYSLGVVGYFALSGQLPFEAEQATEVLAKQVTEPAPPLVSVAPLVPRRMAQAIDAELFVVYTDMGQDTSEANQKTLIANFRFAENVGASIVRLQGKSVAEAVAEFVREKHVTQVVFGRSATRGWKRYFYLSAIHQFLRDAPAVDVHIVTQEPG